MKNIRGLLRIIGAGVIGVSALSSGCAYRHQVYQTEIGKLTGAASLAACSKPVYYNPEINTPSGKLCENGDYAISADARLSLKHHDLRKLTLLSGIEVEHGFSSSLVGEYQKASWAERDREFHQLTPDALTFTPYAGTKINFGENYFTTLTLGFPMTKLRVQSGEVIDEKWNRQNREEQEVTGKRIGISFGKRRMCNSPRDPGIEVHLDFTRYETKFFDEEGNLDLFSVYLQLDNIR